MAVGADPNGPVADPGDGHYKLLDIDCGRIAVHVNTDGLPVVEELQLREAWPAQRLDPTAVE
ncbi:hypothetical protein [Streptomyces sp. UG1]|uniref:hypothetical protein n=1 Tax=Streptomyces sp. UG1 TaxID=3417652 RepID=UPI003CF1E7F5